MRLKSVFKIEIKFYKGTSRIRLCTDDFFMSVIAHEKSVYK